MCSPYVHSTAHTSIVDDSTPSSGSSTSGLNHCLHKSTTVAEGEKADNDFLFQSFGVLSHEHGLGPKSLAHRWHFQQNLHIQNSHTEPSQHLVRVKLHSTALQTNCQQSLLSLKHVGQRVFQCNFLNTRWSTVSGAIHEKDINCTQWKCMCSSLLRIFWLYFHCPLPKALEWGKTLSWKFSCAYCWKWKWKMAWSFAEQSHVVSTDLLLKNS